MATALKVLSFMAQREQSLAELCGVFERVPQVTGSYRSRERRPVESLVAVREVMAGATERLAGAGRVLVRWSGTETKLRFMVEGEDETLIRGVLGDLEAAAARDLG